MSRYSRIIFIFFICFHIHAYPQTNTIDNFKKKLTLAVTPQQKAEALLQLCSQKYSLTADTLYSYATEVKKIATVQASEHNKILADYYITYSLLIKGMEDSGLAITNYYLQKLHNNGDEYNSYMQFLQLKGLIFYRTHKTKESIDTYYKLLNEAQQHNDTLNMFAAKRGLSLAYVVDGHDEESLKIFYEAKNLVPDYNAKKYQDVEGLWSVTVAISFLHLHQRSHLMLYADSCEYYGNRAIDLGRKTDNLFTLCQGLVVKGLILSYKKDFKEAEENLQQGLQVRKIIGDTVYILSDMTVLASFYANTKQTEKGIAICNTGIALCKGRKIAEPLLLLFYNALAENYKAAGDYKQYSDALKQLMNVKDSLNKKNSTDELNNLQTKYNLQKQENTNIQQRFDLTRKNYWLYGSGMLLVFAVILSYVIFKSYRRKQELKMEIMQRNAESAVKIAEESERERISRDLHDNLGAYASAIASDAESIQNTTVANKMFIDNLKANATEIMTNLRDTIWALNKDVINVTGISDRFKNYIRKIQTAYPAKKILINEDIKVDQPLSPAVALNLYRIIQEAVHNSLKHSEGDLINVDLHSNHNVQVSITDNGKGFSFDDNSIGYGLQNMKARAKTGNLILSIEKNEPTGIRINISTV